MPTTPQNDAGSRIEPPVSVPSAPRHSSAATAAAEPPEEPPATRSSPDGLRVGPNAEFSVDDPIANSSILALPTKTAPAARSLAMTVASYGGTKLPRIFDAQVVRIPRVRKISLMANGIPHSAGASPAAIRR